MRRLFYVGLVLLILFEAANVYFIMPLPFSQRMRTIDVAYFLHVWRWVFRAGFGAIIGLGFITVWKSEGPKRILGVAAALVSAVVGTSPTFRWPLTASFSRPRPS